MRLRRQLAVLYQSLAQSQRWRSRFALTLVVAAAIHLPATPFAQIVGLMSALFDITSDDRHDYDAGPVMIAVELADPPPAPKPREEDVRAMVMDAPPMTKDEAARAIKLPAGAQPEPPKPNPEAAASAKVSKPLPPKVPEAIGLAGEVSRAVEGKTNVTISVWMDGIVDKPAGEAVLPLLTCGAMGSVFRLADVDPTRDLLAVLFAGPQLYDTSEYVTAIEHRMGERKLHDAFDLMVQRPKRKGHWIDDTAAQFWAYGAERVGFPHTETLAFITPTEGWREIRAHERKLALPASRGRALSFGLLKPSIPLKKLGVRLPASIKEMRLDLYLSSTGVTTVRMAFEDASKEAARDHAQSVSTQLEDFLWRLERLDELTSVLAPSTGRAGRAGAFEMPPLAVVAEEERIVGGMDLNEAATRQLLGKLTLLTCPPPGAKAPEPPGIGPAPAASAAAPAVSAAVGSAPAPAASR